MKKPHRIAVLSKLFALLTLCINLTACLDCCDDDSVLTPNQSNNGPIFEPGLHPVQIGDMIFEYNPDYSIALFGDGPYAKATYNPFEITWSYSDYPEVEIITNVKDVKFNQFGKIDYFKSEFTYNGEGIMYTGEANNYLKYDSNNRLIQVIANSIFHDYYDESNSYRTENQDGTIELKWESGNLIEAVITAKSDVNGNSTTTYNFEYGNLKNELQQYIPTIYEDDLSQRLFDTDDIGGLIILKLLGNPSEYFVTKVSCISKGIYSEYAWEDSETASYSYTFNDDKTIKSYTVTKNYDYGSTYTDTYNCVFTDDYSITPNIQEDDDSRSSAVKKKYKRKSRLFKHNRH